MQSRFLAISFVQNDFMASLSSLLTSSKQRTKLQRSCFEIVSALQ